MFGKILYIGEDIVKVEKLINVLEETDLMNLHVVFQSEKERILGEILNLEENIIIIKLLGEFEENKYISGVLTKPKLNSVTRLINEEEINTLVGIQDASTIDIGSHAIYKTHTVTAKLNTLFSNHLAIFGNSGSGKSYGVSRIIQNLFYSARNTALKSNIILFDSFGEYKKSFKNINQINPNYNYKFLTTNKTEETDFELKIPLNLMNLDDFTLLLSAEVHSQIPIINHSIILAKIFSQNDEYSNKVKNHLIAKALIAILFSNETIQGKKNDIFNIINICNTKEFNFDTEIKGLGYTRTFSECFEIDSNGNFGESVLITDYILKYIDESIKIISLEKGSFNLKEFEGALNFTLISEGFQNNKQLFDASNILKVRLQSLINSPAANYFTNKEYTLNEYISSIVALRDKKAQLININLEGIDDALSKTITKIISRLIFEFSKTSIKSSSIPFHLFLEEAHRYIQNDNDTFLIGYNIFDRIAKEGRKYGVLLNLITQRPVEMSDTVISQCSNFFIFKMTHPKDLKYIEEMLPNISADIIDKQKTLQPGTCVAFGNAFKIPMVIKLSLPNPEPSSSSADVVTAWQ